MSVVSPDVDGEAHDRVKGVWETAGWPMRSVSLFYALYQMAELDGVGAAEFDFRQFRDDLYDGLYWYGVVSSTRELAHMSSQYVYDGVPVYRVLDRGHANEDRRMFRRHVVQNTTADPELSADLAMSVRAFSDVSGHSPDDFARLLAVAERDGGALSNTERYVRAVRGIFEGLPHLDGRASEARYSTATGWGRQFNGPQWAEIARHLERHDSLSRTAWVDQAFSLQHSTGNWLDKIEYQRGEYRVVRRHADFDTPPTPAHVLDLVGEVLDAARDGDMGAVFEWAVEYDEEVAVSLGRYARQRYQY